MWLNYQKERFGYESIEEEWGFALYQVMPPNLWVREFYIKPEHRGNKHGVGLMDRLSVIAGERSCKNLVCEIWANDRGAARTLSCVIGFGFQVVSAEGGRIILGKVIGED